MSWYRYCLSYFSSDKELYVALKNVLGFYPGNISLYKLAFAHKSAGLPSSNGQVLSNERLEYLGDAIVEAAVSDHLYMLYPFKDEGFLTEMRAKIVNRENLKKLALKIGLDDLLEHKSGNHIYQSIYGDAFEALIGAIYLDKGYKYAQEFIVNRIMKNHVDVEVLQKTNKNFKGKLLNWAQKKRKKVKFQMHDDAADGRLITVSLSIDNDLVATASDFSKKKAEMLAAEKACEDLGI
ncbi:MAG: ribonuclease III [Bacteroidia bacterium]|nr:ribonuclease III [Bacteroidia bacterium]